ncbi:unnamed protein product [marine sediment metagenome]|uniref:Uncharacterized protein n=1 Tax=marine sediment metagenome TaxID=412755 RepID=X1U8A5_9ZZZZ
MKQDIHELSDFPRYPIGFRYPKTNPLDLRSWRYGRAGNALSCQFGAHLGFAQDVGKPGASAAVTVDLLAAGKYTLEITVSDTDGRLGNGNIAKDELAGGYILIYPDGMDDTINRMVVANTATIGGGVMTIKVLKPLPVALSPNPHAEIIANPYLGVLKGNYDRQMIVGMPTRAALEDQYLWLQT